MNEYLAVSMKSDSEVIIVSLLDQPYRLNDGTELPVQCEEMLSFIKTTNKIDTVYKHKSYEIHRWEKELPPSSVKELCRIAQLVSLVLVPRSTLEALGYYIKQHPYKKYNKVPLLEAMRNVVTPKPTRHSEKTKPPEERVFHVKCFRGIS